MSSNGYFDAGPSEQLEFAIYGIGERRITEEDTEIALEETSVDLAPGGEVDSTFGDFADEYSSPPVEFEPFYYPSRFTIKTEKELQRTASACEGEKVSIKDLKNSELHVTGKIHSSDLPELKNLREFTGKVEVITPAIVGGGMEAYVKSAEQGDLLGYDAYPDKQQWMFEYTIDLVSTGKDEYDSNSEEGRFEPPDVDSERFPSEARGP